MKTPILLALAMTLAFGSACSSGTERDPSTTTDAGPATDAGTTTDAGMGDSDAGPTQRDAGTAQQPDAGPGDTCTGENCCSEGVAGCTAFEDRTAAGAAREITFSFDPSPRCLKVKAGQQVTFNGPSDFHPLVQNCGPASALGNSEASPTVVTYTTPGLYGYFCSNHGNPPSGSNMAGAILVEP